MFFYLHIWEHRIRYSACRDVRIGLTLDIVNNRLSFSVNMKFEEKTNVF